MHPKSIISGQAVYSLLLISFVALAILPVPASAQQATPPPGEYVTDGGGGNLTVKNQKSGTAAFSIMVLGANGHTCTLDGEIKQGRAELAESPKDKPCMITFRQRGHDIDVVAVTPEDCRGYCGMRAWFEGLYLTPPKGCDSASLRKTRVAFKRLYDKKSYEQAKAALAPVIASCEKTLYWTEAGRIRNDLAITEYKLGNMAACRQILAPLSADAEKTDEELRDNYPPTDADNYLPVIKATRTNLRLCEAVKK